MDVSATVRIFAFVSISNDKLFKKKKNSNMLEW